MIRAEVTTTPAGSPGAGKQRTLLAPSAGAALKSGDRWIVVAVAAVLLAVVMGQTVNGVSAFFGPLEAEFGWTRADTSLINAAGLVGLALGGVVMGFLADRLPIRKVILLGAIVSSGSGLAASQASSLWQFCLLFFLMGAFGAGALFGPLFALVGAWFRTGAGLAIGLVSAGQAIGQGGMPLLDSLLIDAFGWRTAFAAVGAGSLVLLLPLSLLVRPAPAMPPGPTVTAAPRAAPAQVLPLIAAAVLLCCSLMSVPLVHLLPLIRSCGVGAPEASGAVLVMMLSAIGGRIAFGRLADRIGAVPAYMIASGWQTTLVFGFVFLSDIGLFYLFAPIYGFGYGGVMTCVLATIREAVPADRRASRTGLVMAFAWAGHGIGGYFGGALYDMTGSYDLSFLSAAMAGCLNLILLAILWRASRGGGPGERARGAAGSASRRACAAG
jgi:MFS family permease